MSLSIFNQPYPVGIYLFKFNNRNTRARCEICSKLTIKTLVRRQWRRSGVFTVNLASQKTVKKEHSLCKILLLNKIELKLNKIALF